jgi:polygalacturonase
MANRVPAVDNSSYQLPPDVRQRIADNLIDPGEVEGAAIVNATAIVTVTGYGAVGDGVTDDSAAINAALDAAAAQSAVTLLPPGDYAVGSRIIFPAGARVVGYGATIHRKAGLGTLAVNWVTGDTTTTGYEGPSNITLEGITFDAHGDTQTSNPANVVGFGHCKNIRIIGCTFRRTSGYHALELNAVDGAYVENCRFEGFSEVGGLTEKEALQIDCATPGDYGAADNTPAKNVTIIGCVFEGYAAVPAHHTAIGGHTAPSGFYDNITVIGCTITNPTVRGINAYYWRGSTILNCTVTFTGTGVQGIRSPNADALSIIGCRVAGPGAGHTTQGITVSTSSANCKAIACHVTGVDTAYYAGTGSTGFVVEGCTSYRTIGPGVLIDGANDSLVSGNNLLGAGYTAGTTGTIRVTGSAARVSISGNRCRPHGAGTEASAAVSINAGSTDAWVFGNDFLGMVTATSGTVNTTSNRV